MVNHCHIDVVSGLINWRKLTCDKLLIWGNSCHSRTKQGYNKIVYNRHIVAA